MLSILRKLSLPLLLAAALSVYASAETAKDAAEFTNSLKMKFARVPGTTVLFGVWETRAQDFRAFAQATSRSWGAPAFDQAPTHPAVKVNWEDAIAFCQWLTAREKKAGTLPEGWSYRLPTDAEWSVAAGLKGEFDPLTKTNVFDNAKGYPWGGDWPPSMGAGNYDPELGVDKFRYTAPVGSFAPNQFGLYDLGGNVWEWCMDSYNNSPNFRILRGASWRMKSPADLAAAFRIGNVSDLRLETYGFRCVIETALKQP